MTNSYFEPLTPEPKNRPTLKYGSGFTTEWSNINAWVYYLQMMLQFLGYDPGILDGKFGTRTKEAVKGFQADYNLVADGIVGKDTWTVVDDQFYRQREIGELRREGWEIIPMGFEPVVTREARKPLWWAIIALGGLVTFLGYKLYKK